jgi:xanthine dehydrogenase accessory factor
LKEIRSIIEAYDKADKSTMHFAMATVVRVEGSSYRRMGARMLIQDNGNYIGGISGGCLEGDALRRAQKAIYENKSSLITYDTTQEDGHEIGIGLGCNGIIDVLITPLEYTIQNPIELLRSIQSIREPVILITTFMALNNLTQSRFIKYTNDNDFIDQFEDEITGREILNDIHLSLDSLTTVSKSFLINNQVVQVLIEVIKPTIKLIIFGSNYDIYPLLQIANELGWETVVVTNKLKASKRMFASATEVIDTTATNTIIVDNYTAVLLMAHDYQTDYKNLKNLIYSDAFYIGLLGPRKRGEKMLDNLAKDGIQFSDKEKEHLFFPTGLDIGASTPEEIAVSIAAEIISTFTGKSGTSLSLKQGTIHDH